MRVLYWVELFWPHIGGVEVFSTQLINALQKRGHTFFVVTSRGSDNLPEEEMRDGMHIYRFRFQRPLVKRDLVEMRAIRERLVELKLAIQPDLVHLNSSASSVFFHERTAKAAPAPVLFTIHSPFTCTFEGDTLLGRLLSSASWVTAVSEAMLQDARCLVPEIASRSSVIFNSLESPRLEPSPLPFVAPRILCLGRVVRDKGFDVAIDAFALLVKHFPGACLVIAGDGPAGPALEQQVARLGLADSVEFLGWVAPERVPQLLNSVTVMVVPSRRREPFGLVALQAAQMARPVVATRRGGLQEVVADRQTGLLVEKDDAVALADAIGFLLGHPATAIQLGNAARQRASEVFGWERFVDAYDALYRNLGQTRCA